ncbi:MAG: permease [Alphaproteobacteria bacterium]
MSRLTGNRRLGIAENKGRYDLPLNQSAGTHFLVLLVALMTFLAMMAITATMVLGGVTKHWSSGLENKLTIEIPALKPDGKLREAGDIKALSEGVTKALEASPNIKNLEVLGQTEIHQLVSPWLGDDVVLDDIPLPGLISLHVHIRDDEKLAQIEKAVKEVAPDIRVDTHESWLDDILRLARTMKLSSLVVTLIITLTTVTAIAGAIRSRMAEHKADIELLHLMGASDLYITRQLRRHAVVLTLKGSVFGAGAAILILFALSLMSGGAETGLLPGLSFSAAQIIFLAVLPLFAGIIASYTARFTVLRVLGQMP